MEKETITVKIVKTDGILLKDLKGLSFIVREDFIKADGYKNEGDKVSRIVSAYFKRKYIGEWEKNEHGKPVSESKYFNISHTCGAVVFAASVSDIGIDIEKIRVKPEKLKRYVSSKEEYAYIKDDETFFEIWTAKESLVKAAGTGIYVRADIIPAIPFNGVKVFNGAVYFSRCVKVKDYVISITRLGETPFDVNVVNENVFD